MRRAKVKRIPWNGNYAWEAEFYSPVTGRPFVGWYATWTQAIDMAIRWVDFR